MSAAYHSLLKQLGLFVFKVFSVVVHFVLFILKFPYRAQIKTQNWARRRLTSLLFACFVHAVPLTRFIGVS